MIFKERRNWDIQVGETLAATLLISTIGVSFYLHQARKGLGCTRSIKL